MEEKEELIDDLMEELALVNLQLATAKLRLSKAIQEKDDALQKLAYEQRKNWTLRRQVIQLKAAIGAMLCRS
jgi:hypothetical protein